MARPMLTCTEFFTSSEIASAAGLSARNFGLLTEQGLAPRSTGDGMGKAGHRSYDGEALAQAALAGALHMAGFELLVSARLAAAFASDYEANYGKLPSNLEVFLQAPRNPRPGQRPWTDASREEQIDITQSYWLHQELRNQSTIYQRETALVGDLMIEIADGTYVMTHHWGAENIKTYSPTTPGGLPVSPDYRIVGRGRAARIVRVEDELSSLDFTAHPQAGAQLRTIEQKYLDSRDNAVTIVKVNLSLAIRNAFDRIQDIREQKRAA